MFIVKKKNFFILLYLFFLFCFSNNAQAYLDPGSSNSIIQIIIAALAGFLATLKIYWIRLKNFFYTIKKKKKKK